MRQPRAVEPVRPQAPILEIEPAQSNPRWWWAWIAGAYIAIGTVLTLLATLGERKALEPLPEGAVLDGLAPVLDIWFRFFAVLLLVGAYFYGTGYQVS
jgi:hypothetical protein